MRIFLLSLLLSLSLTSIATLACERTWAVIEAQRLAKLVLELETISTPLELTPLPDSNFSFTTNLPAGQLILRIESRASDISFEAFAREVLTHLGVSIVVTQTINPPPNVVEALLVYQQSVKMSIDRYTKSHPEWLRRMGVARHLGRDYVSGMKVIQKLEAQLRAESQEPTMANVARLLPAPLLSQIADFWAGFLLLGIPDAHADNWMVDEDTGHFVVVDFAYRGDGFDSGESSLRKVLHHSPLTKQSFRDDAIPLLMPHLSAPMREKLKALDAPTLRQLAAAAHDFPIGDKEIAGVLARAKALLAPIPST